MQTVAHHGRETAFGITEGIGPTLCCVHGSGGSRAVWKAQRARLEHPVAALDLAGHGHTADVDVTAGEQALQTYVRDTLAVAEAVDADVLVGNSLGGAVVLAAILDHDPDIDAAILVGSGAKLGVAARLRSWLEDDWEEAVAFLHGTDLLFHDPPTELRALSEEGMHSVGRRITRRDFLTCHEFDVRNRLSEIPVPVLALTGVHDSLTPPRFHAYLSANCPTARAALVPDAAHLSMLERPGPVNRLVTEFLRDYS